MANRLARSLSPYLRQHADNPVDWWEWSDEAFAEARRRDVPVLLSVGYAACHWCHVMAHESFEDAEVAAALNDGFVAVKVDREERPDVDAVYMAATTALTGQGGWPMTCVLTPDGEPFFAGTYFPRTQFLALLGNVRRAWAEQRERVHQSGAHIASRLRELQGAPPPLPLDTEVLDSAVRQLRRSFDEAYAGFGGAPKFPPSMVLEFLLRHHARTGDEDALAMVERTAVAMARGGIYDQLAGGFARYGVDRAWAVPHFEKMLYDNALLARVYAHWFRSTGSALARRVAVETADFIVRDLGTEQGGFASALDADTVVDGHSHEGLTYAWTPGELRDVLGDTDGTRAAETLGVTDAGTFEHGSSTLQLPTDPDPQWWAPIRETLLAARAERPQPARDDKVVTSWNGLALAALADVAVLCERPDLLAAAQRAGRFVLDRHIVDFRLRRTSRDGDVSSARGVLDDYGNLAEGLLALHQADGDPTWLDAATGLLDQALVLFRDDDGSWHDTGSDAEALLLRPRSAADNAEPSGVSAIAGALLTAASLTGSASLRDSADEALAASGSLVGGEPRSTGWALAVGEAAASGPIQVAIVHPADDPDSARALLAQARRDTSPGLVLAVGAPDAAGQPLLRDRPLVAGRAAAYVCRGFVCDAPVSTPDELRAALAGNIQEGPIR
jgi:uncharacterized protein YyaL (SSP411 family)